MIPLGEILAGNQMSQLFEPFLFYSNLLARASTARIRIKQKSRSKLRDSFDCSAEKEGFEPPEPCVQLNGFQDRRIRPLCHFSGRKYNAFCFFSFRLPAIPLKNYVKINKSAN
jgi:hypothetical protein